MLPCILPYTVGFRVSNIIIANNIVVIGCKEIAPVCIAVCIGYSTVKIKTCQVFFGLRKDPRSKDKVEKVRIPY